MIDNLKLMFQTSTHNRGGTGPKTGLVVSTTEEMNNEIWI